MREVLGWDMAPVLQLWLLRTHCLLHLRRGHVEAILLGALGNSVLMLLRPLPRHLLRRRLRLPDVWRDHVLLCRGQLHRASGAPKAPRIEEWPVTLSMGLLELMTLLLLRRRRRRRRRLSLLKVRKVVVVVGQLLARVRKLLLLRRLLLLKSRGVALALALTLEAYMGVLRMLLLLLLMGELLWLLLLGMAGMGQVPLVRQRACVGHGCHLTSRGRSERSRCLGKIPSSFRPYTRGVSGVRIAAFRGGFASRVSH